MWIYGRNLLGSAVCMHFHPGDVGPMVMHECDEHGKREILISSAMFVDSERRAGFYSMCSHDNPVIFISSVSGSGKYWTPNYLGMCNRCCYVKR